MNKTKSFTASASRFAFYNYDHLGNTRVTYTPNCNGGIVSLLTQTALDYYPYGKELRSYNSTAEKYKSTYNERDIETGYDFRNARSSAADVVRFNSVDPMASKYPSLSGYNYVGGNPVRFVDITGMDTTVYLYFDPASKHFNGENGKTNRKKLISSMQAIFDANGVPVHIVVTSLTPNDMTNNSSLLDKTDQYVVFSAGMIGFEGKGTEKGFTDNQFSFVNLLQGSFGGDALFKSEGPDIDCIANTAAHETIHGYLKRAAKYFGQDNKHMELNDEQHKNGMNNLMQDGGERELPINRTGITSKNIVAQDKLTQVHQQYVRYFIQENVHQNGCYPLLK